MGFLPQIVNLQWARTLSAPGQPLIHWLLPPTAMPLLSRLGSCTDPPCLPLHICQPRSPQSSLSLRTLISTWPHYPFSCSYISLAFLKPFRGSLTTSSLYLTFLNILFTFSCYTGDLILPRTLVLLQVLAIFSPTLCVTKSGSATHSPKTNKEARLWKGKLALLWMLATG